MPVFLFLLFLFIVIPLVELALLLSLSNYLGWWWQTLFIVVVTGMVGAALAKRQGWQTWMRLKQNLSSREMPTDALLDGMMILIAGAFLITPGILTDCTGFLLLFPPFRKLIKQPLVFWLKATFFSRFQSKNSFSQSNFSDFSGVDSNFDKTAEPIPKEEDNIIDVPFTRKTND